MYDYWQTAEKEPYDETRKRTHYVNETLRGIFRLADWNKLSAGAEFVQESLTSQSDNIDFEKTKAELNEAFESLPSPKCIVTTEKDTARLIGVEGLSEAVRQQLYLLPVRIRFMSDQDELFNQNIIGYVHKNSRNSILAQAKDDHKPHNGYRAGNRPRTISFRNHRQAGDSLQ